MRKSTKKSSVENKLTLIQLAAQADYKQGRNCWFEYYKRKEPDLCAELEEVARDWSKGGQTRTSLHSMAELHKFLVDNCKGLDVKYDAFRKWMIDKIGKA